MYCTVICKYYSTVHYIWRFCDSVYREEEKEKSQSWLTREADSQLICLLRWR